MKLPKFRNSAGRMQSLRLPGAVVLAFLGLRLCLPAPARAAVTVTNCTDAKLRAAMAGGGTVTFDCDGTIMLGGPISISANTTLDGSGHQITLSGGNAVQTFYVSSNTVLTLSNLTIANGYSANGGAICNDGGQVVAQNCIFSGNQAVGAFATSGPMPGFPEIAGRGGAIFNVGELVLQNCVFNNNQAIGGEVLLGYGGSGLGGAIFNLGTNVADNCVFGQNSAKGGTGGSPNYGYNVGGGGAAEGGAIYNSGSLTITRSSITNNLAFGLAGSAAQPMPTGMSGPGFAGGSGGAANGGAICNSGALQLQACTVAVNQASGGSGGTGGAGGATDDPMYSGDMGDSGGSGGSGGPASGGIYNAGTATLVNATVALNGGSGGRGGTGGTGGPTTVRFPDWAGGSGGGGGAGGSGYGGINDASGTLLMTNCTVALNDGSPGSGGGGGSGGSGTAPDDPLGPTGPVGSSGSYVGGVMTPGCVVENSLLASNIPSNWSATNIDAGHNLSSDASCAFTGTDSRTNINPLLGPLADNGGLTLTMALLPGSPAIDAGSAVGAPATDERGVARPQGPGVDIGAFEFQYIPVFTQSHFQNATNFWLQMAGLLPNQRFTVQASPDVLNWLAITNFIGGTNGLFQMVTPAASGRACFYRVKSGAP